MRTLKLIAAGIILFASNSIHAQISVSLNIGSPPSWGPVGYEEADYYYLPDVEAYYDIRATQFIYFDEGRWIRSRYLPREYRNYDLYNGYKVVLNDYHGSRPYRNFDNDRMRYYRGYHGRPQRSINYNNRRECDNRREYDNDDYDNDEGHGSKHGDGHERD
ncbi:hypothetical protein [Flavobacterium sp. AED]|uniref:hypothetical protein n=1 Tax=Flavobacterium sp. AED TaxID=1423323 RepID=UPI00057FFE1D|nr:hypothetical protein [Flavobacterium sp. AED]KIA82427.1 hypothetical protein OA85_16295 [Flavobacterium sp. AED]